MAINLITLPASSGKTTWVIDRVRAVEHSLAASPRVILPSRQQVWDFQARLANAGGSIGVRVGTISELAGEILTVSGNYQLMLPESIQIEILRVVLDDLDLDYYRLIKSKPGFVRTSLSIIREFKAGGITPGEYSKAALELGRGPGLIELGQIYSSYANYLKRNNWADRAGLAWLAAEVLENQPALCTDWGSLYVDGFDDLTPVQLRLITTLSDKVEGVYLTLTGSSDGRKRDLVHKRFMRLKDLLEKGEIEDLPIQFSDKEDPGNPSAVLEKGLFDYRYHNIEVSENAIELAAVPDREAEVRTALRWIKKKILDEEIAPSDAAIIARNFEPYRGLVSRISTEYKIPVRLQGGLPLAENPLVATILKLGKLISEGKEGLAWFEILSIWRSPYLRWSNIIDLPETDSSPVNQLSIAKQLDEIARWGRVIQGFSQWEEAFLSLIKQKEEPAEKSDDREDVIIGLPRGKRAESLRDVFLRFVDVLTPPEEPLSREGHIRWFETLLGGMNPEEPQSRGLDIMGEILSSPDDIAQRDWQALAVLWHLFKERIWAERLLKDSPVNFAQFFQEMEEIVSQSSYQPHGWGEPAVFCASCAEVRGLSFQAAVVLGLAEGEFPAMIKEDPFLRDADRHLLAEKYGLPLRLSMESAEAGYFYEALTRSTRYLLLTRPRIAENGSRWQASPFWEEVLRIINIKPVNYTSRSEIHPELAANQAELLQMISARGIHLALLDASQNKTMSRKLEHALKAGAIFRERNDFGGGDASYFEGNLADRKASIAGRYPEDHVWSASRLESYQTCPFSYFIGNLLGLVAIETPEEGLDPRQLGNIYHRILERLYQAVDSDYSIEDLLQKLPEAAYPVFKMAPKEEGFRETAWWIHSQQVILDNLKMCLISLEGIDPRYRFLAAEKRFGMGSRNEVPVSIEFQGQGRFLLRGLIDRVDVNDRGGIRIIDYKTSGKFGFDNRAVREGKKLQLPLYAIAAEKGLGLGKVKEGFYFHLLAAEPSSFKMSTYKDGPLRGAEAAMNKAAEIGWLAISSIKSGNFSPRPPENGCPDYCPAVDFCWKYQPQRW